MKKISLSLLLVLLFSVVSLTLSGCGIKYCSVSNCPKESFAHSEYCPEHKCANTSCKNKAIQSYSYCTKCIECAK